MELKFKLPEGNTVGWGPGKNDIYLYLTGTDFSVEIKIDFKTAIEIRSTLEKACEYAKEKTMKNKQMASKLEKFRKRKCEIL